MSQVQLRAISLLTTPIDKFFSHVLKSSSSIIWRYFGTSQRAAKDAPHSTAEEATVNLVSDVGVWPESQAMPHDLSSQPIKTRADYDTHLDGRQVGW